MVMEPEHDGFRLFKGLYSLIARRRRFFSDLTALGYSLMYWHGITCSVIWNRVVDIVKDFLICEMDLMEPGGEESLECL